MIHLSQCWGGPTADTFAGQHLALANPSSEKLTFCQDFLGFFVANVPLFPQLCLLCWANAVTNRRCEIVLRTRAGRRARPDGKNPATYQTTRPKALQHNQGGSN